MKIDEQIPILIKLQKLDLEIDELEMEYESIPHKIELINESLKENLSKVENIKKGIMELQKERKYKEIDLETAETNIAKHMKELYQVKTNEQYQALLLEIEKEKEMKGKFEEEIIKLFDEIDIQTKKLKDAENEYTLLKKKAEEEIHNLEETMKELEKIIKLKKEEKQNQINRLDEYVLKRYEKTRQKKEGIAIAKINEETESCEVCNMKLSKQTINDVETSRELVFCDNCSRILYLERKVSPLVVEVEGTAEGKPSEESPDSILEKNRIK